SRVGAPLRIVHAYLAPRAMHLAYSLTEPGEMHSSLRQQAEQWTRAAFLAAMEAAPLLRPEVDLRTAEPISTLLEASRRARMLVVGARGFGGFTSLQCGSVATAMTAHGHCPVVVVRGPRPGAPPAR